jgi:hypothetical protein
LKIWGTKSSIPDKRANYKKPTFQQKTFFKIHIL